MSKKKECFKRNILNFKNRVYFAETYQEATLPVKVYEHKSLIMRKLGNEALVYQENKKINFKKVIPKLTNILIKPGQVFSFWKLVGYCSQKKGFLDGVTIKNGEVKPGTAGGMCQMTNLIHWLVLHSPLDIIEHHHHHRYDLFPDYNRQIPFGTGTSIMYNYLDYRFKNVTNQNFQLLIEMDDHYLKGKLTSSNISRRLRWRHHSPSHKARCADPLLTFVLAPRFVVQGTQPTDLAPLWLESGRRTKTHGSMTR